MPTLAERLETATTTLEGLVANTTGTGDMVLKNEAEISPLTVTLAVSPTGRRVVVTKSSISAFSSSNVQTVLIDFQGGEIGCNVFSIGGKYIGFGGNFSTSGSYAATLTLTGVTNVTLPTSGTVATLAGVEVLSNKSLGAGWIQGINYGSWIQFVSGTGAATGTNEFGLFASGPSTAVGYALRHVGPASSCAVSRGKGIGVIDFSKPLEIRGTILIYGTALHANCTTRFTVGKIGATDLAGDLVRAGIGCKVTGTGALQIHIHDGSNPTTVATSFTPVLNEAFDILIRSDGAGGVTMWVNDTHVGTNTGGPTGSSGGTANSNMIEVQNQGVTTTQGNITFSNFGINYGR